MSFDLTRPPEPFHLRLTRFVGQPPPTPPDPASGEGDGNCNEGSSCWWLRRTAQLTPALTRSTEVHSSVVHDSSEVFGRFRSVLAWSRGLFSAATEYIQIPFHIGAVFTPRPDVLEGACEDHVLHVIRLGRLLRGDGPLSWGACLKKGRHIRVIPYEKLHL